MFITSVNQVKYNYQKNNSLQFKSRAQQLKSVKNVVKSKPSVEVKTLLGTVVSAISAYIIAKNTELFQEKVYVSRRNLARMLHCHENRLNQAIRDGELVLDNHRGVNINDPVNKAFIESLMDKQKDAPQESNTKQVRRAKDITPNHIGVKEFGRRIGLVPASVRHHISKGHIICNEDGIDLANEQNIHFINNYKRKNSSVAPKLPKISNMDNYNGLKRVELADMLRISAPTIKNNFDKGLLVKNENGYFSLDEPVNKAYINKYDEDIRRLCKCADEECLEKYVDSLKKLLKNRVSENVYTVASKLYDEPEEFSKYLKYSLSKIVDFDTLDSLQIKMLAVIFEEMIIDRLNSESSRVQVYHDSDKKLDVMLYRHLLDELNLRNGNMPDIVDDNVDTSVKENDEYYIGELKVSHKLDEILEKAGQEYEREIKAYRNVINKNIEALADAYVQHNFIRASGNYYDLRKFSKEVKKRGLPEETDYRKIKIIVEKIFSQVGSSNFVLTGSYKNWKKEHKVINAEAAVSGIVNKYFDSLITKICTEESLNELKKANPTEEIIMSDLENIVYEKFDL